MTTEVITTLMRARTGVDRAELAQHLQADGGDETVATLMEQGLLVPYEAEEDTSAPEPWRRWGSVAWAFHQRARATTFFSRGTPDQIAWSERLRGSTPPRRRVELLTDQPAVMLPRVTPRSNRSYFDVLESRRTHRHFEHRPISLEQLASLLAYTLGPLRFADARELGEVQFRAPMCGGARHETYGVVAVLNVSGLAPGLYVYDDLRHGLVWLSEVSRSDLEKCSAHQGFFLESAFALFTVADAAQVSWKYHGARTYRILLNNVGAIAQVFSMTAEAHGLGAAATAALRDEELEAMFDITPHREFVTFAMACGHPLRNDDGMPVDYLPAGLPSVARSSLEDYA